VLQLKEINPALPESALEQVRRHYEITRRRPGGCSWSDAAAARILDPDVTSLHG